MIYCNRNGLHFFEVSALKNHNLDKAMDCLAREIFYNQQRSAKVAFRNF